MSIAAEQKSLCPAQSAELILRSAYLCLSMMARGKGRIPYTFHPFLDGRWYKLEL
jgi:hypothetical protein